MNRLVDGSARQYFSTTLEKGLRILSLFNERQVSLSLTEISRTLGLNKTSTYRFVKTLVELGYLRKDPQTKRLTVGLNALAMGHNFMRGFDLLSLVKPYIDRVVEEHHVAVDSGVLYREIILVLYRREISETLVFRMPTVTPDLHSHALGKSALAWLPPDELEKILDRMSLEWKTENTITTREGLLAELELTRQRGYSLNNEEFTPGLIAVGAPLINLDANRSVGAVTFDFSTARNTLKEIEKKYASTVMELAADISKIMPLT